ncbi:MULTISPECIES: sensor histidine kinase [unclassified Leisingera]|uniref:sensor histidine kinase n=1 Tax=unclassified Leisingera TaxID=2614906 RepID=UPI000364619F|nr:MULTISPECIES: PAS domain-containing sensor histidine kinase [unclassified Leisingera]
MFKSSASSLRGRVAGLSAAISITAVVLLTLASGLTSRYLERQRTLDEVMDTAALIARATEDANGQVVSDAVILASMPAVAQLTRNGGGDPASSEKREEALARLAKIFSAFFELRPAYEQIRLVGIDDNGREILRLNRQGSEVLRVPEDGLQEKAGESYFQDALSLNPRSALTGTASYNRENGRIAEPRTVMYRVLVPAFRDSGEMFGFIIINVNVLKHNRNTFRNLPLKADFVLHNTKGGSYAWDAGDQEGVFSLAGSAGLPDSVWQAATSAADAPVRTTSGGRLFVTTRLDSLSNSGHAVSFTLIKQQDFFARFLPDSTLALIALGLVFVGWSARFSRKRVEREMTPMVEMSSEIIRASNQGRLPDLPTHLQDEVGDLARSFEKLITKLRQQESSALMLFNGVGDGLAILDRQGKILRINSAMQIMFQVSEADAAGNDFAQFLAPGEWERFQHGLSDYPHEKDCPVLGRMHECEGPVQEGGRTWLELTLSPIPEQASPSFALVVRDITERRKMLLQAEHLIEQLNRSNKDLVEFAYVASHDLKAPLRAISHAAAWLEEDLADKLTEGTREHISFMKSRIGRMSRLLDDLLEHSRIGNETHAPAEDMVDGSSFAEDLELLAAPPDDFSFTFDDSFKQSVFSRFPLQIVLLNLITNAIKHNDKEHGEVHVSLADKGDLLEFTVTDNGPGIPKRHHETVFGLFKTLAPRDKVEGSGMGLSLVRKHLHVLGHDIRIVSDGDNGGTQFIFTWPRKPESGEQNAA